jgi:hypothetical protein
LPHSHRDQDDYRKIFEDFDFKVLSIYNLRIGGETMLWVPLRKPSE